MVGTKGVAPPPLGARLIKDFFSLTNGIGETNDRLVRAIQ